MKKALFFLSALMIFTFFCVPSFAKEGGTPFIEAGCVKNEYGYLDCSNAPRLNKFSCGMFSQPDHLGGLGTPIVKCCTRTKDGEGKVIREGCTMRMACSFIVKTKKGFVELGTKEEFIEYFTPLRTAESALSFAAALKKGRTVYTRPERYEGAESYDSKAETIYEKGAPAAFNVRLFESKLCGCGTHPIEAVDYKVSPSGEISELGRKKIAETKMTICID